MPSTKRKQETSSRTKKAKRKVAHVLTKADCLLSFEETDRDNLLALLNASTEDDPPVVFIWHENLSNLIDAANAYDGDLSPPFANLSRPYTIAQFKAAVLEYARAACGCPPPQFGGVLQCTGSQYALTVSALSYLCFNQWIVAVVNSAEDGNATPLASVVSTVARSNNMTNCMAPLPPGATGVPVW